MFILPSIRRVNTSCLSFLMLHFLHERQAMPLQYHQPFQVLLLSRHTSNEDLVRLSENRKQLLAFLTRDAHGAHARLVCGRDLFHQFSRADFHSTFSVQSIHKPLSNFDRPHRQLLARPFLLFSSCTSFTLWHPIALCLQLSYHSFLSS